MNSSGLIIQRNLPRTGARQLQHLNAAAEQIARLQQTIHWNLEPHDSIAMRQDGHVPAPPKLHGLTRVIGVGDHD